jgi:glycosyltransferase involved in cell wall biosynthesis
MIKVGVVVQRYGQDVVGGAESLARVVSERLNSNGFDVTVFTTTAKDYLTWKNVSPPGNTILKGVVIKRFSVEKERDIENFNQYSEAFFSENPETRDEQKWIREQGPFSPDLIKALKEEQSQFDIFLFFTYLYYPTIEGLRVLSKPAILFPTAHDEPPIYLKLMKGVFQKPKALYFLTEAELKFVKKRFAPKNKMELVRTGVDILQAEAEDIFREKYYLFAPYILYAGRIEKGKGLELVFEVYPEIKKNRLINLVLIGKKLMDIPVIEGIRYLGYIPETDKLSAFRHAILSIQPSPLESLSITTLESFAQKTPVLVNQNCQVLVEHLNLSGGGLLFSNQEEFIGQLFKMFDDQQLRWEMGNKGYEYVRKYYSWETVLGKIRKGIQALV